jgi:hypothetical protein
MPDEMTHSRTHVQSLLIRLDGITAGDYLTWVRDPEPPALDRGLRSVAISAEPLGELVNIELVWAGQPPTTPGAAALAAGLALTPEVAAIQSATCTADKHAATGASRTACWPVLTARLSASERRTRASRTVSTNPETANATCDMSQRCPPSWLTSALADKVVIPLGAGHAQLPPLTEELRHLVESMLGAQRV